MNAQIRITTEIVTSDAHTVWISCAGYREHVTFKGRDKAKRARAWADRVGSLRTLADHLRNIAAADEHADERLSPSFFGILAEEQIRLEAIAMSHMNEKDRQTYESLQDQAGEGTW